MGKINTQNEHDNRTVEESWKLPVLSSIADPPANPTNGDRHRIIATASGIWEGKENQIAIWDEDNQEWFYETYQEGSVLYDLNANDYRYVKNDGSWEQFDKIPLAISDVTGLQSALDDKEASADHDTDISTLQTNIDAKEDALPDKTGNALKYLRVNATENGFEFAVVSAGSNSFEDASFEVIDEGDNTKKAKLDVGSLIPTGTTITLKVPNANLETFATLESNQVFQALVQALTMVATNSLTTAKTILTDSATDPTVNGEIQRNGNSVKVKSDGVVRKIAELKEDDELQINGVLLPLSQWMMA